MISRSRLLIRPTIVRTYVNNKGKRVSKEFLTVLNDHVLALVDRACNQWNGGKKTLDAAIAAMAGARV